MEITEKVGLKQDDLLGIGNNKVDFMQGIINFMTNISKIYYNNYMLYSQRILKEQYKGNGVHIGDLSIEKQWGLGKIIFPNIF